MSDLTDYVEDELIDWAFLNSAFDSGNTHSNVYIALHTGDPNDTGDNTEPANQNEVSASDYAREQVTADTTEWSKGTNGTATTITNDNEISFGVATNNWGDVSHFSIWTTSDSTGNPIFASSLDATKTVNTDDEIRFQAGDLTAQID